MKLIRTAGIRCGQTPSLADLERLVELVREGYGYKMRDEFLDILWQPRPTSTADLKKKLRQLLK